MLSVPCMFCLVQELQTAAICRIWSASKILSVCSMFFYIWEILLKYCMCKYPVYFLILNVDDIYTVFLEFVTINSDQAYILQTNATRWLRKEAGRRRLVLQWRAAGRELQLGQQLQEEVCLPVSPADLHLHPLHQPKHLTVRLQVCTCAHFHPFHHPHPQPQSWAAHKHFLWWTIQCSVA